MIECRIIADKDPALFRRRCNFRDGIEPETHEADAPHQEIALLGARHAHGDIGFAMVEGGPAGDTGDGQRDIGMFRAKIDRFRGNEVRQLWMVAH